MKKPIKTIRIIVTMGITLVGAYWLGTTQAETTTEIKEVVPDGYIDTNSEEFYNNYVDMREVVYFEVMDGLQLYYADGTGYYWE